MRAPAPGLGSLRKPAGCTGPKVLHDRAGERVGDAIGMNDRKGLAVRRGIRAGGPRSDGLEVVPDGIGEHHPDAGAGRDSPGKPAAGVREQVLADAVDLCHLRAAGKELPRRILDVGKGQARLPILAGRCQEGGSAAGNERDHQRALIRFVGQLRHQGGRPDAVLIRDRVAPGNLADPLEGRLMARLDDDEPLRDPRPQHRFRGLRHGPGRLPEAQHEDPVEPGQVEALPGAEAQDPAVDAHAAGDYRARIHRGDGCPGNGGEIASGVHGPRL